MSKKSKADGLLVIGAGLPRTGTLSTRAALQHLLGGPCYHGAVPTVAACQKKYIMTRKFFRWSDLTILKPGWRHLSWESWILAQKGKWTRIWKDFFSGGCWKAIGQEWTGLSAVGTVNLLRCTRTPRSDGAESKRYLELNQKNPRIKGAVDCERSGCLVLELLLYHHLHYKVLFNHNSPFYDHHYIIGQYIIQFLSTCWCN